jgi:acetoin utilization deacetylase AcuC-like enzyme
MQVFQRIHDRLLASGDVVPEQVVAPACDDGASPTDAELARVHTPEYLSALSGPRGLDPVRTRRIGFGADAFSPSSSSPSGGGGGGGGRRDLLMRRTRAEVAGTLLAARLALERGLAVATAGGTHHARAGSGAGFCVVNDLAYAAATLVAEGAVGKVLICDLDVHQGDGTASIFSAGRGGGGAGGGSDDSSSGSGGSSGSSSATGDGYDAPSPVPAWIKARVFTLSVHAASNFPARKEASSLDVPLRDGCADAEYLGAVAGALERAAAWLEEAPPPPAGGGGASSPAAPPPPLHPSLVLYDAGADVHADDSLGRLALTDDGMRRREMLVLDAFLARGVPVAGVVGGGYAPDLGVLAERHMHLHRAALRMWDMYGLGAAGAAGWAAGAAQAAQAA